MASESDILKLSSYNDDQRKQLWSYCVKSGRKLFEMVEKRRKMTGTERELADTKSEAEVERRYQKFMQHYNRTDLENMFLGHVDSDLSKQMLELSEIAIDFERFSQTGYKSCTTDFEPIQQPYVTECAVNPYDGVIMPVWTWKEYDGNAEDDKLHISDLVWLQYRDAALKSSTPANILAYNRFK